MITTGGVITTGGLITTGGVIATGGLITTGGVIATGGIATTVAGRTVGGGTVEGGTAAGNTNPRGADPVRGLRTTRRRHCLLAGIRTGPDLPGVKGDRGGRPGPAHGRNRAQITC